MLFFLLCLFASCHISEQLSVVLNDTTEIDGFVGDLNVTTFLGIPYAKPPVDDLRFKDPVAIGPLNGTFNATSLPNICYQQKYQYHIPGNELEDCLYLSVYSPDIKGSYPVMFWIHGGGYTMGSGNQYPGYVYAGMYDTVLVAINYRLGPFGFLYTGTTDAPGSQGLKDQNLALQWVKKNIDKFGGDPNSITIFGESAGAGSVSHHVLSPMSNGLYHRAIMESGTANAPWSYSPPEVAEKTANVLLNAIKCDGKSGIECLKSVEAETIVNVSFDNGA